MLYPDEDDEIEYDSDGNPLPPQKSKVRYIGRKKFKERKQNSNEKNLFRAFSMFSLKSFCLLINFRMF